MVQNACMEISTYSFIFFIILPQIVNLRINFWAYAIQNRITENKSGRQEDKRKINAAEIKG
jgi:hypothetical protein